MVDIHCHILPAMDDGAKDIRASMELCALAADNNISHIIATPHCMNLFEAENFIKARDSRIKRVEKELEEDEIPVKLYGGAEVLISDDIFYSPDLTEYKLAGSRYLLIEFVFDKVNFELVSKAVSLAKEQGLVPIIAHPERYRFFQRDYDFVNRVADLGVLFQVNISSILRESPRVQIKLAKAMINAGMVSFIASDAHNLYYRNNALSEMLDQVASGIERRNFKALLTDNGMAVIEDREIPYPDFSHIKKTLF